MGKLVVNGATLKCTMGAAPAKLVVLPASRVAGASQPAATVQDNKPTNLPPPGFGVCNALPKKLPGGAPGPCTPQFPAPWAPGSPTVKIGGAAALNDSSTCACAFTGTVSIQDAGQTTVTVA